MANQGDVQSYHCSVEQDLNSLLEKFWHQEELPSSSTQSLSPSEKQCEDYFARTVSRDATGRYTVRLPFKLPLDQLGDSATSASRMLASLQRRFQSDQTFFQTYSAFLTEYESLQHMVQVPDDEADPAHVFYLPHHGVIKESSSTTKLRVVFNGPCRVSTGLPINQLLHTGAKLQLDLFDVVIRWRTFRYIFSADIKQMYRQINIHQDDWDLQRILWKVGQTVIKYRLTTVTYGLACAPYLALRTLQQLILDEGSRFPLAAKILTNGRYVDDIFGGANTVEEAQQKAAQVNQLCMAGGFPLRKWISNNKTILDPIPSEYQAPSTSVRIQDNVIQALGLSWNPSLHTLQFNLKPATSKSTTKRVVLSKIAQFFDPLGLLSPLFIKFKIFMQGLWTIKLGWDDQLPSAQMKTWTTLLGLLTGLDQIQIPRWIGTTTESLIELHGFCDASQLAMAATVFLKTTKSTGQSIINLLCSKTKVAPLKRMTIPRLELAAAVMLVKLVAHCFKVLNLGNIQCFLWTDSSIVHTWLNSHPSKWKEFVHNRVCFIQETLPQAKWRHVSGKINPADCATRGLSALELKDHIIWWSGPSWLEDDSSNWPSSLPKLITTNGDLEQRATTVQVMSTSATTSKSPNTSATCILLSRYSSLTRLLRATSIWKRVVRLLLKKTQTLLASPFTPDEHEESLRHWVDYIQGFHFKSELKLLMAKQELPKSSPLLRLLPFIDGHGLLRVGGRLKNSSLEPATMHPYILPKESLLTTLIIREAHYQTLHGSTQGTLNFIRNKYWVLGGRATVRSFIVKCVTCLRYRHSQSQQLMGQLPASRVTSSRAFLHSGVDYAGPYILKTWKRRNAPTYKSWVALFICYSTSAIHLEIVTDYSTDAFLAAYRRFTSRRGIPATLASDCGTNFKGVCRELQLLFSQQSEQLKQIASTVANDGTKWVFNPPAAPHFGGK